MFRVRACDGHNCRFHQIVSLSSNSSIGHLGCSWHHVNMRISVVERGCLGPDREGIALVLINPLLDSLIPIFLTVPVMNPLQIRVEGLIGSILNGHILWCAGIL